VGGRRREEEGAAESERGEVEGDNSHVGRQRRKVRKKRG
jgi:hypothetical protein